MNSCEKRLSFSVIFHEFYVRFSNTLASGHAVFDLLYSFYPRDAMLARVIVIATCLSVRLSVCLSVCPSRAGIVSKRRKLAA